MLKRYFKKLSSIMRNFGWDWLIMGAQLVNTGYAIWYNALNDNIIHPAFQTFSQPYWIFLPFMIGFFAIYIGISNTRNKYVVFGTLVFLTLYWSVLVVLLFLNDDFAHHIPIDAIIAMYIVPKIWYMAFKIHIKD